MNENEQPEPLQKSGNAIAGFFCAGLLAVLMLVGLWLVGILMSINSDTLILLIISLSGIVSGIILYMIFKGSRKRFARGALIFTIVCFVLTGACWIIPSVQIGR
jgi:hypothetical protein